MVWTPGPTDGVRKGLGKSLPKTLLSAGMLPLVLMRKRMSASVHHFRVLLTNDRNYVVFMPKFHFITFSVN